MEQDLREMFKKQQDAQKIAIKDGHEARFLKKLERSMPAEKTSSKMWFKIAASIVVILGIGFGYWHFDTIKSDAVTVVGVDPVKDKKNEFTFGDLSPDLKKVESYYIANINLELAKLEVSPDTKQLIDSFMEQLNNLNVEYNILNNELKELGPNDQTIKALIENLQLRLQLLQKLKKKLNEFKLSKNEQINENSI